MDDIECSCHPNDYILITEMDEKGKAYHLKNEEIRRNYNPNIRDVEVRAQVTESVQRFEIVGDGGSL